MDNTHFKNKQFNMNQVAKIIMWLTQIYMNEQFCVIGNYNT